MRRIFAVIAVLCMPIVFLPAVGSAQSRADAIRLHKEADALKQKARSYSDLKQAEQKYLQAIAIYQRVGERKNLGIACQSVGIIYSDWGQYAKAVEFYEKSLAITRQIGPAKTEGQILNNLGLVYKAWGQYAKAVEFYEKDLAIARKIGDVKAEGTVLGNLGIVYDEQGQYAKAVEFYEKDLAIARKIGYVKGEGYTLNNLGVIYWYRGQYAKAVEFFQKDLAIFRKIGDVKGEGATLGNLGVVYGAWGHYAKEVEFYEKSLAISRRIGDVKTEGKTLGNLGLVYQDWGEYDKALTNFQKVLAIYLKIGVPTKWPKESIGNLYLDRGEIGKAEPFIKEANYTRSLGRLSLLKADYGKAKEYYGKLRQDAEKNQDSADLFTSYTGLGMTYEKMEDNPAAADYFRKAIDRTEDLRAGLNPAEKAEFYNVRVGGFYRTAPYEGLARVLVKLNKPLDALKESEYTRARMFAERISKRAEGSAPHIPQDVLEKDSQLNDQLAGLSKNIQKAYEKQNKEVIAALEPQMKTAKENLAAHIDMLRKQYPLFAATKYPQPMGLDQSALKDNEWVLAYQVTDPGIIIYLTRGKHLVKGLFKPTPRKQVDELVRKFRQPMELGPDDDLKQKLAVFDFQSGKRLSDLLLADILPDLPKNTPVIIVPDGSLGVVPFEMLVLNDGGRVVTNGNRPQTSGAEFFGDRNPISYYQSITALTLARTLGKQEKPGQKLLAMVDPVFSSDDPRLVKLAKQEKDKLLATLPKDLTMSIETESGLTFHRLPLTAELGESLKKSDPSRTDLYEGMTAKKSVLLGKDLTPYRSLVFGTHGYAGEDLPGIQEPVLVLSLVGEPKGHDGFLRLSEVMGLKLNCDVAALTACQSGLGRQISGEGTMGMGRAFQYAGAKSVLMSLWSVSETASVNLVESFFKHLKEGKNKLEALRLARQEIRKAGYDHPFYWAPFILVGEVN